MQRFFGFDCYLIQFANYVLTLPSQKVRTKDVSLIVEPIYGLKVNKADCEHAPSVEASARPVRSQPQRNVHHLP